MKFLLDQHLPVKLCAGLHALGHEALHVEALGLADQDDRDIWAEATRMKAVVVSKDRDFLGFLASGGQLVWLRVGNCPNRELFAIIDIVWPAVVEQLERGEPVVEVRGEQAGASD